MLNACLFAEFSFNTRSPWFLIPTAIVCAYVFLSVTNWRYGFSIFHKDDSKPQLYKPVPWSIGVAFGFFLLFTIVGPTIGVIAVMPLERYLTPNFHEQQVVQTETNNEIQIEQSQENDDASESANEAQESVAQETIAQTVDNADEQDKAQETSTEDIARQTSEETAVEEAKENATTADAKDVKELSKEDRDLATQHPFARMLLRAKGKPYFWIAFILFTLSVVIIAPIVEELIFRVVLQGAFEKLTYDRQGRDRIVVDGEIQEPALLPALSLNLKNFLRVVLPPALIFAILHFSLPEDPNDPEKSATLFKTTVSSVIGNIFVVAIGLAILKRSLGANKQDLGFGSFAEKIQERFRQYLGEFARGAILFCFSLPLIYLTQNALKNILPNVVVDPVPILVFALWEGVVFFKTHSYPTVVGMHVGLNFTSLLFLCMSLS